MDGRLGGAGAPGPGQGHVCHVIVKEAFSISPTRLHVHLFHDVDSWRFVEGKKLIKEEINS